MFPPENPAPADGECTDWSILKCLTVFHFQSTECCNSSGILQNDNTVNSNPTGMGWRDRVIPCVFSECILLEFQRLFYPLFSHPSWLESALCLFGGGSSTDSVCSENKEQQFCSAEICADIIYWEN